MGSATSNFNLQTLNTSELEQHLKATILFSGNVLIVGRRGSGKTTITQDAIKELNYRQVVCNLSVYDRVDLMGYPLLFDRSSKSKYVEYILPTLFKHLIEGDKPAVLVLDEIDKCDGSLLAPLLELLQFRSINDVKLPNLKACIATSNLISEGGQRPSLPLLDRMEKYMVEANAKQWLDWAMGKGNIHPSIVAFIRDNPSELQETSDDDEAFSTKSPRGWENASKIIRFGEHSGIDKQTILNKVNGCIGRKAGLAYQNYYEHYQTLLPMIDLIMSGSTPKEFYLLEITKQFVAALIVANRFAKAIDDLTAEQKKNKTVPANTKYVGKFFQSIDKELAHICVRGAIGSNRFRSIDLEKEPTFKDLLNDLVKQALAE